MGKVAKFFKSFGVAEWVIWGGGTAAAVVCFFVFGNTQYHYLVGAVIGFTSLVFVSKGNPMGQALAIVFGVFYGIISYSFAYYGEMITYLGMNTPFAIVALVAWLRHPFGGKRTEVRINTIGKREWAFFVALTLAVTTAFYFILGALGTANLIVSTVSVLTSFSAAYLLARRSRFYAICYGLNDIVLIVMWSMASAEDIMYLPMVVCFTVFLALDTYGFVNWSRMLIKQRKASGVDNRNIGAEAQGSDIETHDAGENGIESVEKTQEGDACKRERD